MLRLAVLGQDTFVLRTRSHLQQLQQLQQLQYSVGIDSGGKSSEDDDGRTEVFQAVADDIMTTL